MNIFSNKFTVSKKLNSTKGGVSWAICLVIITIAFFALVYLNNYLYSFVMREIDPYGSNPSAGEKVVAYNEARQTFEKNYVPSELLAKSSREVGYVLLYKESEHRSIGITNKGTTVGTTSVSVNLELRNYKTGEKIASETLQPRTTSTSTRFTVPIDEVRAWVQKHYPSK